MVLNKAETNIIDKHYQHTIQNLQRLHQKTPRCIVFFLAGCLPGEAQLHLKQLSLFSMICHLPNNPVHHHAKFVLSTLPPSSASWFHQIRDLCLQYSLPHPLLLLEKPSSKSSFKKLVKLRVSEYWHQVLTAECTSPSLTSLQNFDPLKASLQHPHPMWTSSAGNSYECGKATVLARMVSGRYRTEMLCRFWSANRSGHCSSPTCDQVAGDLEHLLIVCPALDHIRHRLHSLWCLKTANCPPLHSLIMRILGSSSGTQLKFILDSMAFPQLISLVQFYGQEILDRVMYLTRTWAFSIHKHKSILLGNWPEYTHPKKNIKLYKSHITNSILSGSVLPATQHPHHPEQQDHLGSGLPSAHHTHDLVQAQPVPNYDQPLVLPVPAIRNCDDQPVIGVVGTDGGFCGGGGGVVDAAHGPGIDTSSGGPMTAIDLFYLSFLQAYQCSQGGRVPGVG